MKSPGKAGSNQPGTEALGKDEKEFEVKDAEPRRGVQNISRGRKPPVRIQKQASPGGATEDSYLIAIYRPSSTPGGAESEDWGSV
jgi:hypothetical protein